MLHVRISVRRGKGGQNDGYMYMMWVDDEVSSVPLDM